MTFDYHEPATVDEATHLLRGHGGDAVALAGGAAFAILYRQGLIRPGHVVGLRRCEELRGIRLEGDALWSGALATHREVERSEAVRSHHPALAEAFARIATVRIRHQATVGGNLAHADPAQDPPPMLIALDAIARVAGPDGARRDVPVERLFVDHLTTSLADGELILGVSVPPVVAGTRATYVKFLPASLDDYATVSVAAAVRLDGDGRVASARVALGGAAPVPIRARAVERALIGARPAPALLRDAAELVRDEVDPLDGVRGSAAFKRDMATVWTRRALERLVA
ncbi:MAG TPA: xanthine dehydrogenase family protein subunit M [Candidatus Limnocylindria bacterium]|nr:xanthine dehydrogenase family protein subunit M [Candidatus Limnocylindria bacterium]